jgi:hypothetical protein
MLPDSEPDNLEKVIRFVCGLIIGAILVLTTMTGSEITSSPKTALCIAVGVLAFAFCAMKFGDPFWRWVFSSFRR